METKQRKSGETLRVHFEPEQVLDLRAAAQATGVSAPDIVRAAVYAFMNAMVTIELGSPQQSETSITLDGVRLAEVRHPVGIRAEVRLI